MSGTLDAIWGSSVSVSRLTRENEVARQRACFFRALAVALLVHIILLGFFVFTWKGSLRDYQVDFSFWGGILRQQELMPTRVQDGRMDRSVRIVAPSSILKLVQMNAWRLGSSVEKPELAKIVAEDEVLPIKFMTDRVDLDGPALATSGNSNLDIPDAPKVYLRRPQP